MSVRCSALLALAVGALGVIVAGTPTSAVPSDPAITLPSGIVASPGIWTPVVGATISGSGSTPVRLEVLDGRLRIGSTTGIAVAPGSVVTGDDVLELSGSIIDLNAALATLEYRHTAGTGTDQLHAKLIAPTDDVFPATGHRYEYILTPGTFAQALAHVATLPVRFGATPHLATYTSDAERAFATTLMTGNAWLGASDQAVEGQFVWADGPDAGQAVTTTFWSTGEPNNFNNEDCVMVLSATAGGRWNDVRCTGTLAGYVAEWDLAPGDIPSASASIVVPAPQTISFAAPVGVSVGVDVTLLASTTADLAVAFRSATPSTCSVTGTTLSPLRSGTCTVVASQVGSAGNPGVAAAVDVTRSFEITASAPTAGLPQLIVGDDVVNLGGNSIERVDRVVDAARATNGHWALLADGRVVAAGGAPGGDATVADAIAIAATPAGTGYWTVSARGKVAPAGEVGSFGDAGAIALNAPVLDIVSTSSGSGYWLVAADGGVFAFGDAGFFGSLVGLRINAPVIALVPTDTGRGYWLVASDGGVFAFGDAPFHGSAASLRLRATIVGLVADGRDGYVLAAGDGGVFAFGAAPFRGSAALLPRADIVGIRSVAGGYELVRRDGSAVTFA
jgi:hypothetical protein